MSMDQFLYEHPVFRFSEILTWKAKLGSTNAVATYQALQHYLKSGRIMRIKREVYAVIPPNATKETLSVDAYLIAAKASEDSVVGFHTALELYGSAYSVFEKFYFLTRQKIKPFEFAGQTFQSSTFSNAMRHGNNDVTEVEVINRQGVDIRITSLSRTFVDVLDRLELSGGWEEVIRSLDSIGVLNIDRVIDYCLTLNRAVLNAKVGYCLEQREGAFAPTKIQIERLLAAKPIRPQYASKRNSEPFVLVKKWNVLLPVSVVDKTWEEPQHDI